MHEYEFRLVVQNTSSFDQLLSSFGLIKEERVLYIKPHFRFRYNQWEIKKIVSTEFVYYDSTWFKWIHSIETPFKDWSTSNCDIFLHKIGNYQYPFHVENRLVVYLDEQAKIYTFQSNTEVYRLIFEWEYGSFPKSQKNINLSLYNLEKYKHIYEKLRHFHSPPYQLNEQITRKSVTSISKPPNNSKNQYLFAHKLDGIFGIVCSYPDKIKEKWEDYRRTIHQGITLGNGLVFAAEKLENGEVVLLDLYQVQGHKTSSWSRKNILLHFMPKLKLPRNYYIQHYSTQLSNLKQNRRFKTDGYIAHNISTDKIFKWKSYHSIDLIYYKGYFWLPDGRIPSSNILEDGSVYEISTLNGHVLRKRPDRFKSNTLEQIKNELKHGWNGPTIEPLPVVTAKKKISINKKI